jgi:hypothetical protein|tara:strand:+ start:7261 stop:7617 length:357 start_codon:yes stop_codon:yes gene_type:complete
MKNLFAKITTRGGGYTVRIRFNDEARGERYFDTEFGVHAYQTPGAFSLTNVVSWNGHNTETSAANTIGHDLRVGDLLTVSAQRWSMRGRAKVVSKLIRVTALESVEGAPGFVRVSYEF